jgi:hypothetical protein
MMVNGKPFHRFMTIAMSAHYAHHADTPEDAGARARAEGIGLFPYRTHKYGRAPMNPLSS